MQKPGNNFVATQVDLNVRSGEEVTKKEKEVKKKQFSTVNIRKINNTLWIRLWLKLKNEFALDSYACHCLLTSVNLKSNRNINEIWRGLIISGSCKSLGYPTPTLGYLKEAFFCS